MTFLKTLRKSSKIRCCAAFILTQYIKLVWLTSRWEYIGKENIELYWQSHKAIIGCFWHGRLLMMANAWQSSQELCMLISDHPDGKIMQKFVENCGHASIVGSSSRGGRGAVLSIIRALKQGKTIGITPDGPRGPCHRANHSVIQMARLGQTVVLPFSYSSSRGKCLKSWDRFFIPFPFGRGVFICGAPIQVTGTSKSDEELRVELENALTDLTEKADAYCGRNKQALS